MTHNKRIKSIGIGRILFVLALLGISGQVYAQSCRIASDGSSIPNIVNISRQYINVGTQTVHGPFYAGYSMGGIFTVVDPIVFSGCPWGVRGASWAFPAKTATGNWNGYAHIYPTGVANIGYVLQVGDKNQSGSGNYMNGNTRTFYGYYDQTLGFKAAFRLIATGPVSPGTHYIPAQRVAVTRPTAQSNNADQGNPSEIWVNGFTLVVTGAIATCDLAAGDVNRAITLDKKKVTDFDSANSVGHKTFDLTANCSNASNVTFSFSGTAAAGDGYRFANAGTAGGVGLWLYSNIGGTSSTIPANGTAAQRQRTVNVSSNKAVLPMGAAYWKIGTVTKGTLKSTATVTITYN